MIDLNAIVLQVYPNAAQCLEGHSGETVVSYCWEIDDDRAHLIKTPRCKRCGLPNGPDDYATPQERDAYYRTQQPNHSEVGL